MTNSNKTAPQTPHFPTHNAPRVWLLTSGDSPIGISLARQVLTHGDYVVCGLIPTDLEQESPRTEDLKSFLSECGRRANEGWRDRLRIVALDIRCGIPSICVLAGSLRFPLKKGFGLMR
jgi:NAD(P)-dependent dehydrogenase (short-subunit alcohol dehydrogenase family)